MSRPFRWIASRPVVWIPAVVVILGVGAVLLAWAFHLPRGTFPDWVGSLGTVSAFLLAVFVYYRDLKRRREDALRGQASLFDVWLGEPVWEVQSTPEHPGKQRMTVPVHVTNRSNLPIRDVRINVSIPGMAVGYLRKLGDVMPSENEKRLDIIEDLEMMAVLEGIDVLLKAIVFTDSRGSRWLRHGDTGELELVTRSGDPHQ